MKAPKINNEQKEATRVLSIKGIKNVLPLHSRKKDGVNWHLIPSVNEISNK